MQTKRLLLSATANIFVAAAVSASFVVILQWAFGVGPAADGASSRHHAAIIPRPASSLPAFPDTYGKRSVLELAGFRSSIYPKMVPLMLPETNDTYKKFERFDYFKAVVDCPPSRNRKRYGNSADGGKELCDLGTLEPPCVIYSLGSNGDYSFEQAVLASTRCMVHTFDCTYNGSSIDPERHTYHKLCVGDNPSHGDFKTYSDIVSMLGHKNVALLKIDIEGFEWQVFGELRVTTPHLPEQISTELHVWDPVANQPWQEQPPMARSTPHMALFFMHLANLGYGVLYSEINPWPTGCCAEFTLLRVEFPAGSPEAAEARHR